MNATDLRELDGRVVLVTSAVDQRNPPTGLRGTVRVVEADDAGRPIVQVELEFPQMFTTRARHRTVTLGAEELQQLFDSDHDGAPTVVTLREPLDPETPAGE
ncbi:hypothetical protein [Opitutus sp. ER46]|uniref:hypothetical protein n=1 Tax=Opitutus sp. ER46 TaxID=2161864 RepID=UPI000D30C128|nr:hypothetical protein [Opitutus sp. ER46]PTX92441.1 hypothetical protein DB354_13985 [Opitutus sp. ER46]